MNTIRRTLLATLLCVATPAALADPVLKAGDREVDFAGSFERSTLEVSGFEDDSTTVSLDFRGGRFVTDVVEIGLGASLLRSDVGGDSFTFGQAGPFLDLNFVKAGSRVVPVLGASLQAVFGDLTGSAIELSGGLRVFSSDDVSINWRVFYEMAEVEDDDFPVDQELTTLGTRIGFSWILR